jgi:hypothetical protein
MKGILRSKGRNYGLYHYQENTYIFFGVSQIIAFHSKMKQKGRE